MQQFCAAFWKSILVRYVDIWARSWNMHAPKNVWRSQTSNEKNDGCEAISLIMWKATHISLLQKRPRHMQNRKGTAAVDTYAY